MRRVNLDVQPAWETIESPAGSLDLLIKPLPRLIKLRAASIIGDDFAAAVQMVVDNAVLDWREVYDESDPPKPIPFSKQGLDIMLGLDDELASAVQDRVFEVVGMGRKDRRTPADAGG